MSMSIADYVEQLNEDQLVNCISKCEARIEKLKAEPRVELVIVTKHGATNEAFFPIEEYDTAIKCLCYIANRDGDKSRKRQFEIGIEIAKWRESEANEVIAETRKFYASFLLGLEK